MSSLCFKSKLGISLTTVAALVLLTGSSAAPAPVSREINKAITYLSQYGYLSPSLSNPSIGHMVDESLMRRAIADFQSFGGLKVTGKLDEETTKLMTLPRCGVPDKVFGHSRAKRYVLDSKWSKRKLTYEISKYPSGSTLSHAEVDDEIARAFAAWSNYTDLTFNRNRTGNVDIEIRFVKGDHGDGTPFDGTTYAHTFLPSDGGDAHFDDAMQWTMKSYSGVNLFQVAVHEFGHALGLHHSSVISAVMYPYYTYFEPQYRLNKDDIKGIQVLYGQKRKI